MRDPVTGFDYPEAWAKRCRSPERLFNVAHGLAVLTASGEILMRGYTTGTTAAAACKAAVLSLEKEISVVRITVPCGIALDIPVSASSGMAECRKFGGDYPGDVTTGVLFLARARKKESGVELIPGPGIGKFVRDTPRYKKGTPAISPAPLACILRSIEEACTETGLAGVSVSLTIPEGIRVAANTLNSRIGVEGGLSVLGTTGLVEPWDDHLTQSVTDRISHSKMPILTTGRVGLWHARVKYPDHDIILVGSKISDAIAAAKVPVILFGLPALILRYLRPDILEGTGYSTIEELAGTAGFDKTLKVILESYKKTTPSAHVVIIDRQGNIIGESP